MKNSEIYHSTLSAALEQATRYATSKGYEVSEDSMFRTFGTGGVAYGDTKRGSVELLKEGKEQKKMLHISIYRMDSGTYELTDYIN